MKRLLLGAIAFLLFALIVGVIVLKYKYHLEYNTITIHKTVVEKTMANYKDPVLKAAQKYDLPPEFLLSLIVLESSGRKIVPQRFEKHVFTKLDAVARSKLKNLEGITAKDLKGMTDSDLKDFASSWGPFQIMGYKCLEIGVDVNELQGKNAVMNGVKWIHQNYGTELRQGNYKDAFHLHNTGKPYPSLGPPRTYNKDYVPKGLRYVEEFKALLKKQT